MVTLIIRVVVAETKEYSIAVRVSGIVFVTLSVLLIVVVDDADTVRNVKNVKNGVVLGGTTIICVKESVLNVLVTITCPFREVIVRATKSERRQIKNWL